MNSFFKLFWATIKMTVRNKQALFWMLAFPIIFLVIFGLFDMDKMATSKVMIIDGANTELSQGIVDGFKEIDFFDTEVSNDPNMIDESKLKVEENELDYVFVLPESIKDLSKDSEVSETAQANMTPLQILQMQELQKKALDEMEPIKLTVYYNEGNLTTNQIVLNTVEQITSKINTEIADSPEYFTLEQESVTNKKVRYIDFLMPGILAMSLMQSAIIGIAVYLTEAREKKILKRILATPVNRKSYIASQVVARLAISMVQAIIIIATARILYDVNIYGSYFDVFVVALLGTLVFLLIGFIISSFSKTVAAAEGLSQVISMPMLFLSGVFFSTDSLPVIVRDVVNYLPLTPMINALRDIITGGETLNATINNVWILLAWLAGLFILALISFRKTRE